VNESDIGIIVLAAGASSRLGQPKQLLKFEGETLLNRAVRAALETHHRPVIVVLGSQADDLQEKIAAPDAVIVVNQFWNEGMSSSIRCGLRALEATVTNKIEAAVLMLCDQPLITSDVISRLVDTYRSRQVLLVASEYEARGEKTLGVPALFSRALFPELMALDEAGGAKRIIARHRAEAASVATPEAAFDVDTPEDYRALREKKSSDDSSR
jgi:molybdenum cofactor cytidylyltransferase